MRKAALILLALLVAAPIALADERTWDRETGREKRIIRAWVDLCCLVIENNPDALKEFAERITREADEYITILNYPRNPGDTVGIKRHLILDRELAEFQRLSSDYQKEDSLEPRMLEELRFLLVDHVVGLLAQNEFPDPADRVLAMLESSDHGIKVLGLIMTYRIYTSPFDVGKNTLATIGDRRAYDKVIELDFIDSADLSLRYWAVKIVGNYRIREAHERVARAFRDPSEIIRTAACEVLASQVKPDEAKAQAGKLLLARFRELLDALADDKDNEGLHREAVAVNETLISLFYRDIRESTGGDGKTGFGEIVAPTVSLYLERSERWFTWWGESKYAPLETPVGLPPLAPGPSPEPPVEELGGE